MRFALELTGDNELGLREPHDTLTDTTSPLPEQPCIVELASVARGARGKMKSENSSFAIAFLDSVERGGTDAFQLFHASNSSKRGTGIPSKASSLA